MHYIIRQGEAGALAVCLPSGAVVAIVPPLANPATQRQIARRIAAVDIMYAALLQIAANGDMIPTAEEVADEALRLADAAD
jgi:hypothetical protein